MKDDHFLKMEKMYAAARSQRDLYEGLTIDIGEGTATIGLPVQERYFHALNAVHGSVYFKLLDDAAFFAVNSVVRDVFVLTTSFHIELLKPVSGGTLRAVGNLRFASRNLYVAEARLYNEEGVEVAFGTGNFARSRVALTEEIGYQL